VLMCQTSISFTSIDELTSHAPLLCHAIVSLQEMKSKNTDADCKGEQSCLVSDKRKEADRQVTI
jgi:hypothetical protein